MFSFLPLLVLLIQALLCSASDTGYKRCNWINNTDFVGGKYAPKGKGVDLTHQQCCQMCQDDPQCDFAVLAGPKMPVPGSCWLKSLGATPFNRPGDITCCPEGMSCEPSSDALK